MKTCEDGGWWHRLLFISNFTEKVCTPWAWYLDVDMQLFVTALLLFVIVAYKYLSGIVLFILAMLATLGASVGLSIRDEYTVFSMLMGEE